MSLGAWIVLGALAVLTLALAYVGVVVVPRKVRERERNTLKVFSTAIELRFPSYEGLTDRVVLLSLAVGRSMGLNPDALYRLERAARLRDVGLCAIPWKLGNDASPLSWNTAERATFLKHTEVGGAMLELVPSLREVAAIVRYHHAPYDGSGGPTAPQGESLPLESRIIHVVDEYVARERFQGAVLARDWIHTESARLFDARVVSAFLAVLPSARALEVEEPAAIR